MYGTMVSPKCTLWTCSDSTVWPVIDARFKLRHGSLSCCPRRGIHGYSLASLNDGRVLSLIHEQENAWIPISAPFRVKLAYGESPRFEVSVMPYLTRFTSNAPALPSQRSASLANGNAAPSSPIRRANTTDAGTGKKVLGSRPSRSQAVLYPKSTARTRPGVRFLPLPLDFACQLPVRHLAYWPACRALCGITIPITPPSLRYMSSAAGKEQSGNVLVGGVLAACPYVVEIPCSVSLAPCAGC